MTWQVKLFLLIIFFFRTGLAMADASPIQQEAAEIAIPGYQVQEEEGHEATEGQTDKDVPSEPSAGPVVNIPLPGSGGINADNSDPLLKMIEKDPLYRLLDTVGSTYVPNQKALRGTIEPDYSGGEDPTLVSPMLKAIEKEPLFKTIELMNSGTMTDAQAKAALASLDDEIHSTLSTSLASCVPGNFSQNDNQDGEKEGVSYRIEGMEAGACHIVIVKHAASVDAAGVGQDAIIDCYVPDQSFSLSTMTEATMAAVLAADTSPRSLCKSREGGY